MTYAKELNLLVEQSSRINLAQRSRERPIKAAFLVQLQTFWPLYDSIVREMQKRPGFDPLVVLSDFIGPNGIDTGHICRETADIHSTGLKIVNEREYDLQAHGPDLFFFVSPYSNCRTLALRPDILVYAKSRPVIIPYCTEAMGDDEFLNLYYNSCFGYWRFFTSSELCRRGYCDILQLPGWMCPVTGNPEYDTILNRTEEQLPKYRHIKRMADGRKVLLWTPHYSEKWGTWQSLGLPIIESLAALADKIFVVLRPHQLISSQFHKALESGQKMPEGAPGAAMFNAMLKAGNFWIDSEGAGIESVYAADGLLSDLSSMLSKGMALKKSLFFMKKRGSDDAGPAGKIMNSHMHSGYDLTAFSGFIDMLLRGEDPLLPVPFSVRHFFCGPVDGKAAVRIVDNIEKYFSVENLDELPPLPD